MRIRKRLKSLGHVLLPLDHPVEGIMGTVITAALMAAYSEPPVHLGAVVLGTAVAVVVYWLTHVYAEEVGHGPVEGRAFAKRRLMSTLRKQWALVEASFLPLIVLLVVFALGVRPSRALLVADLAAVLLLVVWGFVTAWRHGIRGLQLFLAGLVAGVLGLVIVVLRALVH
ncbi:hypothetical protein [Streptomyces sp. RPT161]|uniref:hypothetical protein n=1 Tax=Streptomyces sp. RPT161 TaxID=3015993 RepID=UPI0022B885ED|nr:hypothetical protein [Streptomyces sp. RPT161]